MMGIISLEVFEYLDQKYVEVIFSKSSHMARTLNKEMLFPLHNRDIRFVANRYGWDAGADTNLSREDLASGLARGRGGGWEDGYKEVSNLLRPIAMNALDGKPIITGQQKKRCECPVGVLMNQGCQCGGK